MEINTNRKLTYEEQIKVMDLIKKYNASIQTNSNGDKYIDISDENREAFEQEFNMLISIFKMKTSNIVKKVKPNTKQAVNISPSSRCCSTCRHSRKTVFEDPCFKCAWPQLDPNEYSIHQRFGVKSPQSITRLLWEPMEV